MIEQHWVLCWLLVLLLRGIFFLNFINHLILLFCHFLNRGILNGISHLWFYVSDRNVGSCLCLIVYLRSWHCSGLLLTWQVSSLISTVIVASYVVPIPLIGILADLQFISLKFPAQSIYNHLFEPFSHFIFAFTQLYKHVVWQLVESHTINELFTRLLETVGGFLFDVRLDQIQNFFLFVASQVISGHQISKLWCGKCESKVVEVRLAHVWRIETDFGLRVVFLRSLRIFKLEFSWNRFW